MDQWDKNYAAEKAFSYNSAITITLDLDTFFKVTTHPLAKDNLWVKYEPDWTRGGKKWSEQEIPDEQTDGRTDGRPDERTD